MKAVYHAGELAVQERVGVQYEASRVGGSIRGVLPPAAQEFLRSQSMAFLGSVDTAGRVWASLLSGEPGFMEALSETRIRIGATPTPGDPLGENIKSNGLVGMIVLEPQTRRRMRLNGVATLASDGLQIEAEEVWGNCPKYIQRRSYEIVPPEARPPAESRGGRSLTPDQQEWIRRADTFYIATAHAEAGADASHRGGLPGFVQVLSSDRLRFPDYAGNNMFQTLGNLAANPRAGLIFLDHEQGNTLQLTGQARILWDERLAAEVPGAQRLVEFEIDEVIETRGASPLRWSLQEYSPFNPS